MSQNSLITSGSGTGAQVLQRIDQALDSLATLFSGATAPTVTQAYMLWADTTNGLLKIRNAGNTAWITIGTLGSANLGLLPAPTYGSFTAGLVAGTSGTITCGVSAMRYRQEGAVGSGVIDVWGYVTVSSVASPVGALSLTGLPVPCRNSSDSIGPFNIKAAALGGGVGGAVQSTTSANGTTLLISRLVSGLDYNDMATYVQSGTQFWVSGRYPI